MVPPLGDVRSGPTADELRAVSPLPSIEGLLQDLLWAPVAPRSPDIADRRAPCSADQIPRSSHASSVVPRVDCCSTVGNPLEMGPGRWLNALSRDQAMAAAVQLQWDVCLMQTNLDVLDQYMCSGIRGRGIDKIR